MFIFPWLFFVNENWSRISWQNIEQQGKMVNLTRVGKRVYNQVLPNLHFSGITPKRGSQVIEFMFKMNIRHHEFLKNSSEYYNLDQYIIPRWEHYGQYLLKHWDILLPLQVRGKEVSSLGWEPCKYEKYFSLNTRITLIVVCSYYERHRRPETQKMADSHPPFHAYSGQWMSWAEWVVMKLY